MRTMMMMVGREDEQTDDTVAERAMGVVSGAEGSWGMETDLIRGQ